ncbi:MAG: hypothetical protein NTV68_01885 [Methanomicrobiales archaeon]|nr:hypothetical protein [Methanomicrobiales archaeon]
MAIRACVSSPGMLVSDSGLVSCNWDMSGIGPFEIHTVLCGDGWHELMTVCGMNVKILYWTLHHRFSKLLSASFNFEPCTVLVIRPERLR